MLLIERTIDGLRATLPGFAADYATFRDRRDILEPYGDPQTLADALGTLSVVEGPQIVELLIREYQRHRGPVLEAILFVAFKPALLRIRKGRRPWNDEDIDQDEAEAFLKAIRFESTRKAEEDAPTAITKYVARAIKRIAKRARERPDAESRIGEIDEEAHEAPTPDQVDEVADECLAKVLKDVDPTMREILLATYGNDETLEAFVGRTMPHLDERQRNRAYERIRRARTDAVKALRKQREEAAG